MATGDWIWGGAEEVARPVAQEAQGGGEPC